MNYRVRGNVKDFAKPFFLFLETADGLPSFLTSFSVNGRPFFEALVGEIGIGLPDVSKQFRNRVGLKYRRSLEPFHTFPW